MLKPGIRRRLLLTSTLITAGGLFALIFLTGRSLNNATIEFYQHDLESEALLTANAINESLGEYLSEGDEEEGIADLSGWLRRQKVNSSHEFMLVDRRGNLLAYTQTSPSQTMQVPPEIITAFDGKIIHLIRNDTAYTAAPIVHDSEVVGVLQVSAPMSPAYHQAREHWLEFFGGALPVLLLAILANLWLGQTIIRPIKALQASAMQMANGKLDEPIETNQRDELGQLGAAFNYMAGRLSHMIEAQRSFVSSAAHELRSPLMSLKLRTQALLSESLPADQQRSYTHEIDDEVDRLAKLVTSLLTLARLDENKDTPDQVPYDTAAFLQDVAHQNELRAHQAGLHFNCQVPTDLPEILIAAADLRIVIDNLLTNAIKYTPSGGSISMKTGVTDQRLTISIEDTGEGFSVEDQERLFERFFRADRAHSRQVPGSGLGLSIVKTILDHYKGSIKANSPGIGKGAVFEVQIPLA